MYVHATSAHRRKLSSQQQSWPSKEAQLNEPDQPPHTNPYEPLTVPPHAELPPSPTPQNGLPTQFYNLDIDPKWEVCVCVWVYGCVLIKEGGKEKGREEGREGRGKKS